MIYELTILCKACQENLHIECSGKAEDSTIKIACKCNECNRKVETVKNLRNTLGEVCTPNQSTQMNQPHSKNGDIPE